MSAVFGIRWDDGRRNRLVAFLLVAAVAAFALALAMANRSNSGPLTAVVVSEKDGAGNAPEKLVEQLGGRVGAKMGVVDGFVAEVPANRVKDLQAGEGVRFAVADRNVSLSGNYGGNNRSYGDHNGYYGDSDYGRSWGPDQDSDGVPDSRDNNSNSPAASLDLARQVVGSAALEAKGVTGKGVDIALIDSGVVPAAGLDGRDKVVNGPDFSSEGGTDRQFLDAYGHGTHLAGIMAGNDRDSGFKGIAPGARIVNAKASMYDGSTTLVQLLWAIDWVVENRQTDDLNIRVLNLSLGADVLGSYVSDPLAYAAEQAWQAGIVVVAAVGNGNDLVGIDSPAADPYLIAAGASGNNGTADRKDDFVPEWSRFAADDNRTVDVVAPGTSLVSLRVPGSFIDENHPEGRVGDAYFKGSGTSQATAVVSASVALLLQQRPSLTPDQVKEILLKSAAPIKSSKRFEGEGQIDLVKAGTITKASKVQKFPKADLDKVYAAVDAVNAQDAAEGTGDTAQTPETSASRWSASRWSASRWSASRWSASRWSASRWSASRWSASRWSASRWSASRWSGNLWGD